MLVRPGRRRRGEGVSRRLALAGAPKQAVPYLAARLKPVSADAKRLRGWIADLDSDDYEVREAATSALKRLGVSIESAVLEALRSDPPLETRRRLEHLFKTRHALPPEEPRILPQVQALELSAAAEARTLLEALAQGAAGARQTREARDALERLQMRAVSIR